MAPDPPDEFQQLLGRLREGDPTAAEILVANYESLIRREVRLRLEDSRLRRTLDSMDFVQSVMASFFVRVALADCEVHDSQHLIKLLVTMTRNKVASAARKANSQKRDQRRNVGTDEAVGFVAAADETPSQVLAFDELLLKAKSMLSDEEAQLAQLRSDGLSWEEIAGRLGGTAQARRVQYSRACARVSQSLGLEE